MMKIIRTVAYKIGENKYINYIIYNNLTLWRKKILCIWLIYYIFMNIYLAWDCPAYKLACSLNTRTAASLVWASLIDWEWIDLVNWMEQDPRSIVICAISHRNKVESVLHSLEGINPKRINVILPEGLNLQDSTIYWSVMSLLELIKLGR